MRFLSNTHTKMQIRTIRCNKIQNIHYINLLHSDISSSYTDRFAGIVLLAGSSKSGTSYFTPWVRHISRHAGLNMSTTTLTTPVRE